MTRPRSSRRPNFGRDRKRSGVIQLHTLRDDVMDTDTMLLKLLYVAFTFSFPQDLK